MPHATPTPHAGSSRRRASHATARRPRRGGWAAFGLIGLLVVVAIILFVAFNKNSGYVPAVVDAKKGAEADITTINIMQVVQAVETYKISNNDRLPATIADLGDGAEFAYRDPWDTTYRLAYEDGPGTSTVVVVTSAGPDRAFDTDDDITERQRLRL